MSLRFRKVLKLAPGIRLNVSLRGLSATLGPRGASLNIGKQGTFLNADLPWGFYSRDKIGSAAGRGASQSDNIPEFSVALADDGTVQLVDAKGTALSGQETARVKRDHPARLRSAIEDECRLTNACIEAIGRVHLETPDPGLIPTWTPRPFTVPKPTAPTPRSIGLLAGLLTGARERVESENAESAMRYEEALASWERMNADHNTSERRRREMIEVGIYSDTDVMEEYLETCLSSVAWPRETSIGMQILQDGIEIYLDIDLPELEQMPNTLAVPHKRGFRVAMKKVSTARVRRIYRDHVHGVGFRACGEAFAALPKAQRVIVSAYSQRVDPATGRAQDQYLYSARIARHVWMRIDFGNLERLDVSEAFAEFDLRRDMTKRGDFRPIEPFAPSPR